MLQSKMLSNCLTISIFMLGGILGGFISEQLVGNIADANNANRQIIASSIILSDRNGNPRGGLIFDVDGHPVLVFMDKDGNVQCGLGLLDNGPTLRMNDNSGNSKLLLDVTDGKGASISIGDAKDVPQLVIQSSPDGNRSLAMYDNHGKGRLAMLMKNGVPGFAILDSAKNLQISMQARDGKGSLISLHDKGGDPQIALGLRDGKSFMYAFDKDGSGVFGGGQPGKRPALVLKERGKIIWAAGSSGAANDARELERGIDLDA